MNRSAVIIFILLLPFLIFPYQWDPIGPSGIETYDYHSLYQVICTSNGIMLYEDEQWNEYSYGNLPVRGAMEPENVDSNVILVMGQGTDSDGVYMFNLSTHNFTVMYWILNPHFIFRCYDNEKFYAGGEEGLLVSEDGTVWFPIPFFAGKDCLAIAARNDYLVVSAADDIYFSPDNGNQWFPAEAWLWISDMAYHPGGNLYGIFPDGSFSSGLWCSSNNGDDWDVEFWDLNLSSVFLDQESNIFVAWEESAAGQGVAIWHADIMELEYFNDDLPDLHVNNLTYDPYIDCNNVIACTDGGIFMLTGIITDTGGEEIIQKPLHACNYPNPFNPETTILCLLPGTADVKLNIFNIKGQLVRTLVNEPKPAGEFTVIWDGKDAQDKEVCSGIYFYKLESDKRNVTRKMLLLK